MLSHRFALLVVASLITLAPLAQGQGPPQAVFQSQAVEWQSSQAEPTGTFVALQSRVSISGDVFSVGNEIPITDSTFTITAPRLDVETDVADYYLDASPAVASALPPYTSGSPFVRTEPATYTHAAVEGTLSRSDRFLYVFPDDESDMHAGIECGSSLAARDSELRAPSRIGTRNDLVADSSGALEIRPCEESTIILQGTFTVVLWEWDAALVSSEGEASLWSGKSNSVGGSDPIGATGAGATLSKAQQLYLTVHDGTLTMQGNAERPPILFMESLQVQGAEQMQLQDATGQLQTASGPLDVVSQGIELRGAVDAKLIRDGSGIHVEVQQGIESAILEGQTVSLASVSAGKSNPVWLWSMAVIGTVAVPAAVVPIVRRTTMHRRQESIEQVRDLTNRLRFTEARPLVESWLARQPDSGEAHYHRAVMLAPSNPLAAWRDHAQAEYLLQSGDAFLRGENAFQAACLAARLLQKSSSDESLQWRLRAVSCLRQAVDLRDDLRFEIPRYPELAGLADQPPDDWLTP